MKQQSYQMGGGHNARNGIQFDENGKWYHERCCENKPVLEILYEDKGFNAGKPIMVCKEHWEQTDEEGSKYWQEFTESIKVVA